MSHRRRIQALAAAPADHQLATQFTVWGVPPYQYPAAPYDPRWFTLAYGARFVDAALVYLYTADTRTDSSVLWLAAHGTDSVAALTRPGSSRATANGNHTDRAFADLCGTFGGLSAEGAYLALVGRDPIDLWRAGLVAATATGTLPAGTVLYR